MRNLDLETCKEWDLPEANPHIATITNAIKAKYVWLDMDTKDPILCGYLMRHEIEQTFLTDKSGVFDELKLEIILSYQFYAIGKANDNYFIGLKTGFEIIILCQLPGGWKTLISIDSDEDSFMDCEKCTEGSRLQCIEDLVYHLEDSKQERHILYGWVTEISSSYYFELLVLLSDAYSFLKGSKKRFEVAIQLNNRDFSYIEKLSKEKSKTIAEVVQGLISQEINKQGSN